MNEAVSETNTLPKGWIMTTIHKICTTKSGGTPSRKNPEYFEGGIPWVKSGELNDSVIYSCEETISKLGLEKSSATLYPKNTVLLAMYGATIGKVSILGFEAATNQAICAFFHERNVITNHYLFWFLKSVRKNLIDAGFGGAQNNISQEKIKKINIPLTPLNEQKRIVSKIESIFAQIDTKQQELEKMASQIRSVPDSFAELKGSILKKAFEGRLVPQDPHAEPAEILLKKIHKDSAKDLNFEKREHLPKGWIKTKIGTILEPTKKKFEPQNSNNRIFIGLEHVESNTGKILGKGNSMNTKSTKTVFHSGDILYGKLRPYLNKVCIPNFDGVCSTDILVFPQNENFSNKYVSYFLSSPEIVRFATRNSTGMHHPRIKFELISKCNIPLPPINEQKRIVSKIQSIFAQIDTKQQKLEKLASQIRSVSDSFAELKSSILKKAFEGRLVPQNPHDEPASVLLERIKRKSKDGCN